MTEPLSGVCGKVIDVRKGVLPEEIVYQMVIKNRSLYEDGTIGDVLRKASTKIVEDDYFVSHS